MPVKDEDTADEELFEVLKYGLCKCGKTGQGEHLCPYAEDINDDHSTTCNCCSVCVGNCADDI